MDAKELTRITERANRDKDKRYFTTIVNFYINMYHDNGIYFRVKRNNRWESVCFSDLTDEEMDKVLEGHSVQWLKSTCKILGHTIRCIGDELEIVGGRKEEKE